MVVCFAIMKYSCDNWLASHIEAAVHREQESYMLRGRAISTTIRISMPMTGTSTTTIARFVE
jgi:hypothetical protein